MPRWAPWLGIFAPGLEFLVNESVAHAQSRYDPLREYISNLSAPTMLYSGVMRGWWIVFPVLFVPFILALRERLPRSPASIALSVLLFVFALGVSAAGIFHCDPGCRGLTAVAQAHFIASDITASAVAFGPLALEIAALGDVRWDGFRWVNRAWMAIGWMAGIVLYFAERGFPPVPGLCERVFYGVYYLWLVSVVAQLVIIGRLHRSPSS